MSIAPSLITLFIGANSSGKSSVLQALILLKQSAGQPQQLGTGGPFINLGQYTDLVSKGSSFLSLGISGDLLFWEPFEFFREESRLRYDVSWRFGANGALDAVSATLGSKFIVLEGSWTGDKQSRDRVEIEESVFEIQANRNISLPLMIASSKGPEDKRAVLRRDLEKVILSVHKQLELTTWVPPFRGQDLPQLKLQGSPQSQITSTQGSVEQSSRLASTIAYRRELEDKISNWIERITGVRISSELVPGPHVTIRAHSKKPRIKPIIVNEGYGSN